ncbi:hypothetical protein MGL_1455 [Malassezia globosa CBS 7966]|uniref:Uncharacterized protein n=1 Tax=Malassezia globosa (strain ATCC MYA-4612 / CBS 7966) TaxID=425265 RepID=A8PXI5_MALGO|nr:uncharacterized protein MGL_1455 [Malassezia globosa CBS 7966]EDP44058.1 hypothetical protein MGL_1455 [Malassezia globosa CBS 7966]
MFRATQTTLSKASRLPLNSKKANKDFYKGTRAANVLMRKRIALSDPKGNQLFDEQGRPRTWNLRTHRLDEMRMVSYVVPPGLADTQLKPYVYLGSTSEGGTERPLPGQPGAPKMPAGGMNATYYSRLVDRALLSKPTRN